MVISTVQNQTNMIQNPQFIIAYSSAKNEQICSPYNHTF